MRHLAMLALVAACGSRGELKPSVTMGTDVHGDVTFASATPRRRMLPPEAFLRAYLAWFGGLVPADVQRRARGRDLFDQWNEYLGALGLPDYRLDVPRATESNTIMLAAIGRLGEALCFRTAERDFATSVDARVIYAFADSPSPSLEQFSSGFDILHRTFLGYPAYLAPAGRIGRFYSLFEQVQSAHTGTGTDAGTLTPTQTAWASVCTALVQHPEAEVY